MDNNASKKNSTLKFLPKGFVTPEKTQYHAEILANRIRKRFPYLSRRFKREGIECFRQIPSPKTTVTAVSIAAGG